MASIIVPVTDSGFSVPYESCKLLGLKPGDDVELSISQRATERELQERQLEIAKRIMVKRREVLKRLAE